MSVRVFDFRRAADRFTFLFYFHYHMLELISERRYLTRAALNLGLICAHNVYNYYMYC